MTDSNTSELNSSESNNSESNNSGSNTTDSARVEQFKADIAAMNVKTSGKRAVERATSTLGILLMVASLVLGIGSYVTAGGQENALDQNELIVLGFVCVSMAIIGATLWLRTALVRFWRFWMLRSLYEGQAHLDQVVKAIRERE